MNFMVNLSVRKQKLTSNDFEMKISVKFCMQKWFVKDKMKNEQKQLKRE